MASPKAAKYDRKLKSVLGKAGYQNLNKLTSSLQGSVWSATLSNNKPIIIKVTDKSLHERSITTILEDQKSYECQENILKEASILKYLTTQKSAPQSIVKFVDFLESNKNYYLVMENGGHCLFDFVIKAHRMISAGVIDIKEWHRVSKIIFKQMMEAIEFLHSNNVCHFDISLENFLINDVDVVPVKTPNGQPEQIRFCCDDVQVKLCDFGLAEKIPSGAFGCNKYVGKMNYRSPEIMHKKSDFNAKSNDIWCLGVGLYALIMGSQPFKTAHKTDTCFRYIMNGQLETLLKQWNQMKYVDQDLIDLFQAIFQAEERRIDLIGIKKHSWLRQ